MTAEAEAAPMRRVRPWIAALLTIFGWGVGLYYARSKAAWPWAIAQIVVGVALGVSFIFYALFIDQGAFRMIEPGDGTLSLINFAPTLLVAIIVWVLVVKHTQVESSSPVRLLGYVWIFLAPILISVALAMCVRFTTVQPFRMPSGSMQPTIEVGDYFFTTKWAYGYSRFSAAPLEALFPSGRIFAHQPRRGDVVVFRPRSELDRDFVKRIVGLPGDRVQMIDGLLYLNGVVARREDFGEHTISEEGVSQQVREYRETLPNGVSYKIIERTPRGELDNTIVYVVPANSFFVLGDDRDNSADSRLPIVGYVPFDNIVGRVDRIMRRN